MVSKILDLCGGTGAWSAPYRDAGYEVIVVDPGATAPGAHSGMIPPDWVHQLGPCPARAVLRSMTPPGFARAFFEANS